MHLRTYYFKNFSYWLHMKISTSRSIYLFNSAISLKHQNGDSLYYTRTTSKVVFTLIFNATLHMYVVHALFQTC